MVEGKTKSGFAYAIPKDRLNDMELLDLVAQINEGEVQHLSALATRMLGDEQRKKLYDHVRTEDGRVPIDRFEEEISDIFDNDKLKNS